MSAINQGDIFLFIQKVLGYTQVQISEQLGELVGRCPENPIPEPHISKLVNQHRNGYKELHGKVNEVFNAFFASQTRNKTDAEQKAILFNLSAYLEEAGLTFVDSILKEDDDYESYVKRMLHCGLANCLCRDKDSSKKKKYIQHRQVKEQNFTDKGPKLHDQNIAITHGFIGRKDLLSQIEEKLNAERTVIIEGMAGIGKSCLAREFARIHRSDYSCIQEVIFDISDQTFLQLIRKLDFDNLDLNKPREEEARSDTNFETIMSLLKQINEKTLIIFDNIDRKLDDMEILEILRRDTKVHFIITTRRKNLFAPLPPIHVAPLLNQEQLELFTYHLGNSIEEKEREKIGALLGFADGNTMFIEWIAKLIKMWSLSFDETLKGLRENQDELPHISVWKDSKQFDEDESILNTFYKILFQISISSNQWSMLRLLSLLPSEGISRQLLFKLVTRQEKGDIIDLEYKNLAITESLENCPIIRLHPLISAIVRRKFFNELEDNYCSDFIERICAFMEHEVKGEEIQGLYRLIKSIMETLSFRCIPLEKSLLWFNAFTTFFSKFRQHINSDDFAELHARIGRILQRLAVYDEAIHHFQEAMNNRTPGSIACGKSCQELCNAYRNASDYKNAINYGERAIALLKSPHDIAEAKESLGMVYLELSDTKNASSNIKKARTYYDEALTLRRNCGTPQNEEATYYHNMGVILYKSEEYMEARRYHEKAIYLIKDGDDNVCNQEIAASHAWLGNDFMALDDFHHAKEHHEKALQIYKKILGENHPIYAWVLYNKSKLCEREGNLRDAYALAEHVLSIQKKALGENHKKTLETIKYLESLSPRIR